MPNPYSTRLTYLQRTTLTCARPCSAKAQRKNPGVTLQIRNSSPHEPDVQELSGDKQAPTLIMGGLFSGTGEHPPRSREGTKFAKRPRGARRSHSSLRGPPKERETLCHQPYSRPLRKQRRPCAELVNLTLSRPRRAHEPQLISPPFQNELVKPEKLNYSN